MLVRLHWPAIQHEANGRIPPPIPLPCEPWRKAEGKTIATASQIVKPKPNHTFAAMADVRASILSLLPRNGGEMTFPQINAAAKGGANIQREALRRLVADGEILMRRGDENGKPAYYRLPRS